MPGLIGVSQEGRKSGRIVGWFGAISSVPYASLPSTYGRSSAIEGDALSSNARSRLTAANEGAVS